MPSQGIRRRRTTAEPKAVNQLPNPFLPFERYNRATLTIGYVHARIADSLELQSIHCAILERRLP